MQKVEKEWQVMGTKWFLNDVPEKGVQLLGNCIYNVRSTPLGVLFLDTTAKKFEFDFKIYGLETDFINRVQKRFLASTGNLGILLNGVKGTGKTITAEILANNMDLPIVLVDTNFGQSLTAFLSTINQDIIVLVDEYEKVFGGIEDYDEDDNGDRITIGGGSSVLLSLMDGTLKSEHRRVFIFTTNKKNVNENMINRPGRVRYIKEFKDLNKDQILEILDDCLENSAHREKTLEFIKKLELITVDIVKAIVSEVNTFDEEPQKCCNNFNVVARKDHYNIVKHVPTAKKEEDKKKTLEYFVPDHIIEHFVEKSKNAWKYQRITYNNTYLELMAKPENGVYTVKDLNVVSGTTTLFKIRLEKAASYHSAF